jgi:hypothetical protein
MERLPLGILRRAGLRFQGGWIPFATTKAGGWPRPATLVERYGTLDRYAAIVKGGG